MSAAGIPHPFAATDAQLNPSSYGAGDSQLRNFFLNFIPALAKDTNDRQMLTAVTGNMGMWKSDWTLSDMKEGVARITISNVEELINEAAQDDWYYTVCPRFETNDLNFEVVNVFFRPNVSQEAAPRTVPRQLDIQKTASQQGLTRFINGFQIDTETLLGGVEKGLAWFSERVTMMAIGIMETDKMIIITGIMNMHRAQRVRLDEYMALVRNHGGLVSSILRENEITFGLLKQKDPIRYIRDVSNTDFQFLGVPTGSLVTIMHEHAQRVLVSNEFYRNRSQGDQQEFLNDSGSALSRALGAGIFFVRNFRDRNGQPINVIGNNYGCAVYYPLVDPHLDCPDVPYKTEYRNAKITSSDGNMQIIEFVDAALRTDRWDPVTGELRSLLNSEEWAAASDDLRQRIGRDAASDALHVTIAKPHYEDEAYVGPATHWGSVKQSTISTNTFLSCAKSIIAEMPDRAEVEAGLNEFIALVGEAGNKPVTDIATHLANSPLAVTRSAGMVGCKSSNPALLFHATNPSTGFPDTGYGVVAPVRDMPAGFGSLAGLRFLLDKSADGLKRRIRKVLRAAEAVTMALRDRFASSVLLDPNYAPTDLQYATATDMIFSSALLPRRAVVIAYAMAAGANVALERAVGQMQEDTVDYFANTGKEGSVPPVAGDTEALLKLAVLTIVLRSFKKDASGTFQADPAAFMAKVDPAIGTAETYATALINELRNVPNPKGNITRSASELRRALDEAIVQLRPLAADGAPVPVMTKLYLEPSQVVALAANPRAGFTVGRADRHDVPANAAELADYSKSIRTSAAALVEFGHPLSARWPLTSAGAVSAIHSIGQLRRYMEENGYPIPSRRTHRRPTESLRPAQGFTNQLSDRRARVLKNLQSAGPSVLASPLSSSSAAYAVDPSGMANELFACVDHRVDLMFTDSFAANWDGVNMKASSLLELIVARLYLTTPTNFRKSVSQWATTNTRIPFSIGITRVIRTRTNPVIRMIPGAKTCRLGSGFHRVLSGTDQSHGIFGMIKSYYAGFIALTPKNVNIYNNFDVCGYVSGLENQWANFASGTPGMVAVFMPGNAMPAVFSPFGPVEAVASSINAPEPVAAGSETIAVFEQTRQGRLHGPWPTEERLGHSQMMGVPFENPTTAYYSRDTVMFAGPDCSYTKHVTSMSPIPTDWAGPDLRNILEGLKTAPTDPLRLGANNQLAIRSF